MAKRKQKLDEWKAPWELGEQNVGLYCLYDRARDLYINPLPIDTEEHAVILFGQLLETDGTYAYKGYRRFDLCRLCTYKMQSGRVNQHGKKPLFIKSGMDFYKKGN